MRQEYACQSRAFTKIIVVIALLIIFLVLSCGASDKSHATSVANFSKVTDLSREAHKNWSDIANYDAFEIPLARAKDSSSSIRLICIKKRTEHYGVVYILDTAHPYLQPLFDAMSNTLRMQKCR